MRRQRRGTYPAEGKPYLFFFAALCLHLLAAALIAILPSLIIERKPEQIVTINLADMPAPPSSGAAGGRPPKVEKQPAPPVKPPPEPEKIEATPVKEKVPPPPEPPPKIEPKIVKEKPPTPEPPPKIVSLKPQQVVKKVPPKPEEVKPKKDDKAARRTVDKIKEQIVQESRQLDKRKRDAAEAEAREAEAEAEKMMRDLEEAKDQSRLMAAREQGFGSGSARSASAASSGANSALAQQYYARIQDYLRSHWKLPDLKNWPPNLLATVSITIDKSGKILNVQFQKRSGDDAFDRLVRKAVDDADPLPPIPPALKQERQEFVLSYDPGSISGK